MAELEADDAHYEQAVDDYEEAYDEQEKALNGVWKLDDGTVDRENERADVQFWQATAAKETHQYEYSVQHCDQALGLCRGHTRATQLRKESLELWSMPAEAAEAFQSGVRACIEARQQLMWNDESSSIETTVRAADYFTNSLEAGHHDRFACLTLRAECHYLSGDVDSAFTDLNAALEYCPQAGATTHYFHRGKLHMRNKNYLKAEVDFAMTEMLPHRSLATRFESWPEGTISAELSGLRAECNDKIILQSSEAFAQAKSAKALDQKEALLDQSISLLKHPAYALLEAWLAYKGFTPAVTDRMLQWLQNDHHKVDVWMKLLTEMPNTVLEEKITRMCAAHEVPQAMDSLQRQQQTDVYPRDGITINMYAAYLERAKCFSLRGDDERSMIYLGHAANTKDAETSAKTLCQRAQVNRKFGLMIHAMDDFQSAQVRSPLFIATAVFSLLKSVGPITGVC